MSDVLRGLLHSRKFLLAAFGVIQTLVFQFVPDFPEEVWLSIDGLVAVVIVSIAAEDAAEKSAPVIVSPDTTTNNVSPASIKR